jgi:nucleoside 2-deoxyribosyltransferase
VDTYKFSDGQEKDMMEQAFEDISQCDLLIAETSEKAIGIGVEVGYAKAKEKLIIYLRQTDAEHSTTVSGTSDFQVVYKNVVDLEEQLATVLESVVTFKS